MFLARCKITRLTPRVFLLRAKSDYTGAQTKLPRILLNGNNICMVSRDISFMTPTLHSPPIAPGPYNYEGVPHLQHIGAFKTSDLD